MLADIEHPCETLFTSGTGHGIEQENQALKMLGGMKGIANLSQNLGEYFLSAAKKGNTITTFCDRFGISQDQICERENHYQLSRKNVCKISEVFDTYDVNFDSNRRLNFVCPLINILARWIFVLSR